MVVRFSKSTRGMLCSRAHLSSRKFPSAPESISAGQEADEPAHRRTAGRVVRDLGEDEDTAALASTPLSTGELCLLTDRKRQSGPPHRSKGTVC